MGEKHNNIHAVLSFSLRYCRRLIVVLAVLLACESQAQKVKNAAKDERVCLPVEVLQSLITISVDSAEELLSSHGYVYAASSSGEDSVKCDTIDGVEVRYTVTCFDYDVTDEDYSARVTLMVPVKDLHYNEVLYFAYNVKGRCNMRASFRANGYTSSTDTRVYNGSMSVDDKNDANKIVDLVAKLEQDTSIFVTIYEKHEKQKYVKQKQLEYCGYVDSVLGVASSLAEKQYLFNDALAILDSLKGYYQPKDNAINQLIKDIKDGRRVYYDNLLKTELEKNRYKRAKELLDTLLIITPEWDTASLNMYKMQREGIESLLNRKTVRFSEVYPAEFDSICSQISVLFNTDIRKSMYLYPRVEQKLKYSFHINTDTVNVSNGTVSLSCNTHNNDYLQKNVLRQDLLQKDLNRIAQSPLLKIKKENGVPVMTDETLEGELAFDYFVKSFDADTMDKDSVIRNFIYEVEMEYLSTRVVRDHDDNFRPIVDIVPRKPTMEKYTFGILRKSDGFRNYTDVTLVNFETAMGASWMPSLLVPGLGTFNQKASSSVSIRAVPFFLLAGISAVSFMWDRHVKESGEKLYEVNDPNLRNVLYVKNLGAWVGTACLAISATIYITDLVEGIGNSIRNVKYTKRLRNKLMEDGPIVLRWEDVVIPAGVDVQEENVETETQIESGSDDNKEQ